MKKRRNSNYKQSVQPAPVPRRSRKLPIAIALAAAVLLLAAVMLWPKAPKMAIADFTVYDAGGKEVRLEDFIGKPIVLNFWASWCPPCKAELPDFQDAYETYGKDVQFLMVNMTTSTGESQKQAQALIDGYGYTFPVYFDLTSSAANAYGITSLPTTYFINADGKITDVRTGMISADTLLAGIREITK